MSTPPGDEAARYQQRPQWPGDQARYQTRPMPQQEQAQERALDVPAPPPPNYRPPVAPAWGQGQGMPMPYVQPHSAALGVVASFFVPGLGSMLNEKVGKGIGILACYLVALVLCLILVGFILAPAAWIWGMVAANNDANKWNRAHGIIS